MKTVIVMMINKVGEMSTEPISVIYIVLRKVSRNYIDFGGLLLIFKMYHTQLPLVFGKPFLISSHILSSFQMISLEYYVCAISDHMFQRFQVIIRMQPRK